MFLAELDPKEAGEHISSRMIITGKLIFSHDLIESEGLGDAQPDGIEFLGKVDFGDTLLTQRLNAVHIIDVSCHEVISVVGEAVDKDAVASLFVGVMEIQLLADECLDPFVGVGAIKITIGEVFSVVNPNREWIRVTADPVAHVLLQLGHDDHTPRMGLESGYRFDDSGLELCALKKAEGESCLSGLKKDGHGARRSRLQLVEFDEFT